MTMRGSLIVDQRLPEDQKCSNNKRDFFIEAMFLSYSWIQRPNILKREIPDLHLPVIPCACGRALERLSQPPYRSLGFLVFMCNLCCKSGDGEVYHCETCQFDAHRDCAELKETANVFFHAHPLKLEDRKYFMEKPGAMCGFCEEWIEGSVWGYSCEQCNFYVHSPCTKYHMWRNHFRVRFPLRLERTPDAKPLPQLGKSLSSFSGFFSGGDLGRYCYTSRTSLGPVEYLHPFCAILPLRPICIHDSSHRLSLVEYGISTSRAFYCSRCGEVGLSWAYHCDHCNVDIHTDCVNVMEDEEVKWIEAYAKFMAEYGAKDNHTKLDMISELLDIMLVGNALDERPSSSSRPQRVMIKEPRPLPVITSDLLWHSEESFRMVLAAESKGRKAMRKLVKQISQKFKANPDAMLGNLKNILSSLEKFILSHRSVEFLAAAHVKLTKLYSAMHINPSIGAELALASSSQFGQLELHDPPGIGGLSLVSRNNEPLKGISATSLNLLGDLQPAMAPSVPGGLLVSCMSIYGTSVDGELGMENSGWTVACTCHGQRMSVAKFVQHLGLTCANPGDVVYMKAGGETLVRWRMRAYSESEWWQWRWWPELPVDHAGWEWADDGAMEVGHGNGKKNLVAPVEYQWSILDVSNGGSTPKRSRTTQMGDASTWGGNSLPLQSTELGLGPGQFHTASTHESLFKSEGSIGASTFQSMPNPGHAPMNNGARVPHSMAEEEGINRSVSRSGKRAIHLAMGWTKAQVDDMSLDFTL